MGLLDLLGFNKLPAGVAGSTLVLADATTLARADALLVALHARFGNVAVAQLDSVDYRGRLPQIELSADNALERLKKIRPQRLIMLGLDGRYAIWCKPQTARPGGSMRTTRLPRRRAVVQ